MVSKELKELIWFVNLSSKNNLYVLMKEGKWYSKNTSDIFFYYIKYTSHKYVFY
jgi:hypothetical protein